MDWYVYILEAVSGTGRVSVHVGISLCAEGRMKDHAAGRVKATAGRTITLLGYTGPMGKSEALKLEAVTKTHSAAEKRRIARRWGGVGSADSGETQPGGGGEGS